MANSVVGNNAFLKVTPTELAAKAAQINGKIDAMEALMQQMNTVFDTVSENWQSTSGDLYKDKATSLIVEVKESLTNLTFYVKDLMDASAKYEELESELNSQVGGLEDPSSIFNV